MSRRSYKTVSDASKARIIKEYDKQSSTGGTVGSVAREFSVGKSTLRGWLQNREKILARSLNKDAKKKFRERNAAFDELEAQLFDEWSAVEAKVSTDGNFLRQRATEIAAKLNIKNFKASPHWTDNFKKRFNLTTAKACGTSAAADENLVQLWLDENRDKLASYELRNIFNADETGLFYRLLPSRTLCVKGTKCHGGSQSKQRVSILLCANMTGTEKLTPLVIGKSRRPRCFPKLRGSQRFYDPKKIGCDYRNQRNSWMDSKIFIEWLAKLQYKFELENRKVLLLLDNFSAHRVENLDLPNIELLFLPANTTSICQPLDLGIIANVKALYKRDLLSYYWSQLRSETAIGNDGKLKQINLLQALRFFKSAWDLVKGHTIRRCFQKGLPGLSYEEEDFTEDVVSFPQSVLEELFPASVGLQDYLQADANLAVGRTWDRTVTDDGEEVMDVLEEMDTQEEIEVIKPSLSSGSDEEEEEPVPLVSNLEVIHACGILLRHCNQVDSFGTLEANACFTNYKNAAMDALEKQRKPADIRQFFKPISH